MSYNLDFHLFFCTVLLSHFWGADVFTWTYLSFDHIHDMIFICTQFLVFSVCNTKSCNSEIRKMRPLWLIADLALLNTNIARQIWLIHLIPAMGEENLSLNMPLPMTTARLQLPLFEDTQL